MTDSTEAAWNATVFAVCSPLDAMDRMGAIGTPLAGRGHQADIYARSSPLRCAGFVLNRGPLSTEFAEFFSTRFAARVKNIVDTVTYTPR